jgi:hypothetical protein
MKPPWSEALHQDVIDPPLILKVVAAELAKAKPPPYPVSALHVFV